MVRVCDNCGAPDDGGLCPEDRDGIHIFACARFVEVVPVPPGEDEAGAVERARVALNEAPEYLFRQAAEGKPHAEEEIVRIVLRAVGGG
jgi:hypothetical protein